MKITHLSTALIAAVVGLSVPTYASIIVGPGTNIGANVLYDAGGTRTNVALSSPINLAGGDYLTTQFNFVAGAIGDVEPFLAVLSSGTAGNSNQVFTLIAIGGDYNIASSTSYGTQSIVFGGSSNFVIPAGGETVYAGFTGTTGNNPVELTESAGSDAHNAPAFPITDFAVGGTLSGFNYPSIRREYAFSIEVTPVPLPSTGLLLFCGVVSGSIAALRKRHCSR